MKKYINPDQALSLILDHAMPLAPVSLPIERAYGHVTAENTLADRDYPPFDRVMMDGYAVKLADAGKKVRITAMQAAGEEYDGSFQAGECVEVMTGSACPGDAEAVVQYEKTVRIDDIVTLPDVIRPGMNIARKGSDCRSGDILIHKGQRISHTGIAILAAVGEENVKVVPAPSAGLIITGNEVVPAGQQMGGVTIRDSNGPMLTSMFRQMRLSLSQPQHVRDESGSLLDALHREAGKDIIVLSGGVSMGKFDLVPQNIEDYGATIIFHKVSQKPGKPLLFAKKGNQLIFGLPGNPLSCHLGFHRYIAPAIRKLMEFDTVPGAGRGILTGDIKPDGKRTLFHLVNVSKGPDGALRVSPCRGSGSADIYASACANAYVRLEPGDESYLEGTEVAFEYTGEKQWVN